MGKKKGIASTEQLVEYRNRLKRRATWWGVVWFFIILAVYFIYCFFAIAPRGYAGKPGFSWASNWKFVLPYFNTDNTLLMLSDNQVILRWVTLFIVVILALVVLFVARSLLISSYRFKSVSKHDKALGNLLKENYGIETAVIPGSGFSQDGDVISLANIETAEKEYTVILSDQLVSLDAMQYTYTFDGGKFHGVCAVTELVSSKVDGLIQFRTFGKPQSLVVDGRIVAQYNIWDPRLAGEFTVFSTLSKEEVMAFAGDDFLSRLIKLRKLTSGGLVVSIQDSTLSVLIDGMELRVGKDLKENLPSNYLERQGTAVKALFDIFEGFVKDSSLTAEEKQIPLVQKLGQEDRA